MRGLETKCVWPALPLAAVLCTIAAARAAEGGAPAPVATAAGQVKAEPSGDDKLPDVPSLEPDSNHAKSGNASKRDPAAMAFVVPHGTVLNAKQNDAMTALKKRMEPTLRSALEKLKKAPEGAEKTAAALKVRDIKREIVAEIQKIRDMPAVDAAKQQPAAMQKVQPRHRPSYPNRSY